MQFADRRLFETKPLVQCRKHLRHCQLSPGF
jgi:hypothetical protein